VALLTRKNRVESWETREKKESEKEVEVERMKPVEETKNSSRSFLMQDPERVEEGLKKKKRKGQRNQ
jgi:hypothetical protein